MLPYLTARLEFEVARRTGVLLVPRAALRWKPKAGTDAKAPGRTVADAAIRPEAEGTVWVFSGDAPRAVRPVRVGIVRRRR